jgi:glutamate dehydrogenase/leucine dehydrogenase
MEPLRDNLFLERFHEPSCSLDGFLAIDSIIDSRAVGGVRILPDVDIAEISHMSRTMTKKYLFSGMMCGGAKAGIVMRPGTDRRKTLLAFGKALRPYLLRGFWPGTDLGSDIPDIRTILEGAGLPCLSRRRPPSDKYTAMGVVQSIDAALEHTSLDWSGLRLAVEGFGKVGSEVARLSAERGAKLVAFSNTLGAVINPAGFDAPMCVELHRQNGNRFIQSCGKLRPREAVFRAACDVLVPAARCWSINRANFGKIGAGVIACAANVPMEPDVEKALFLREKIIVPDGIANSGGVSGLALSRHFDPAFIDRVFRDRLRPRVHDALTREGPPSVYLEWFCNERSRFLPPERLNKTSRIRTLLNTLRYHTTDAIIGGRDLLESLYPPHPWSGLQ